MKKFYCVCTRVFDSGRIDCNIVDTVQAEEKPAQSFRSTIRCDTYVDYFDSLEAAQAFVEETRSA